MTNREFAHANVFSRRTLRSPTIQDALCPAENSRRQLVRSLGATLLLLKRRNSSSCVLGANAMERAPVQPQRICEYADAGQPEIDCQHGAEPNGDAVILSALIDRARRVEQHEPFAFAHQGKIRAQDDCIVG